MTLTERARAVRTSNELAALVVELRKDLDVHPSNWTNAELAPFLEAMAAWIQDMDGYYQNSGEDLSKVAPWRIMADMLMAARVYE